MPARPSVAIALLSATLAAATLAAAPSQRTVYLPLVSATAGDPDLAMIGGAAEGLLYPSESDAPLEPIIAPSGLAPAEVCAAEAAPGEPVEIGDVGLALDGPSLRHPWMSAAELEAADRFAALRAEVEARLTGAISCRAGRVRVRVLILGVSSRGLVVGLRTVAVES